MTICEIMNSSAPALDDTTPWRGLISFFKIIPSSAVSLGARGANASGSSLGAAEGDGTVTICVAARDEGSDGSGSSPGLGQVTDPGSIHNRSGPRHLHQFLRLGFELARCNMGI